MQLEKLEAELKNANEKLKEEQGSSQKEIGELKTSLREKVEEIQTFRTESTPKAKPSLRRTPYTFSSGNVRFHTEGSPIDPSSLYSSSPPGNSLDTSIGDRLARMRD